MPFQDWTGQGMGYDTIATMKSSKNHENPQIGLSIK